MDPSPVDSMNSNGTDGTEIDEDLQEEVLEDISDTSDISEAVPIINPSTSSPPAAITVLCYYITFLGGTCLC